MPSLESRNLTPSPRRRAWVSPILHRAKATRERCIVEPTKPTQYIRGLSIQERVDMVLYELNEKHQWSIKDLVYYMVTVKPIKKYGMSCLAWAKVLLDGIYQQEEVVEWLAHVSEDIWTMGNTVLAAHIWTELRAVGKPGIGLGTFDPEADIIHWKYLH